MLERCIIRPKGIKTKSPPQLPKFRDNKLVFEVKKLNITVQSCSHNLIRMDFGAE